MPKHAKPDTRAVEAVAKALGLEDHVWAEIFGEVAKVTDISNAAYGDSTEKSAEILAIFWPDGVPPERMHDFRCMVSIVDKLSRIVTNKDAFGESPWRDVMGYAALAYRHDLVENEERER
jgi:hypothetical protein